MILDLNTTIMKQRNMMKRHNKILAEQNKINLQRNIRFLNQNSLYTGITIHTPAPDPVPAHAPVPAPVPQATVVNNNLKKNVENITVNNSHNVHKKGIIVTKGLANTNM